MRIFKGLLAILLFVGVLGYGFYFYFIQMNFFALLSGLITITAGVITWRVINRRKKKSY